MNDDSVHLDLVLAADEEIDRQLDERATEDLPFEIVKWMKGCTCPRGAFEARALQRGFKFQRNNTGEYPNVSYETMYVRQGDFG